MRIAIVSDLHIGYERFYEDAYAQARRALFLAREKADAIILPGDIFDRRNPHPDAIAQAIDIFRDLSRMDWKAKVTGFRPCRETKQFTTVPVVAIPGTHERVAEGKRNPLGLLGLAGLLVDASEATVTIGKGDERVSVFGLGGLSEERVRPSLEELDPRPVDGSFNIFMFHQSIYELLPFREDFIRFDDLPKGFDLYVDGHIHNMVIGAAHGKPFLIPGSTVLTQLKDGEQGPKGFLVYDTVSGKHEFVPIDSRPFTALHVKFEAANPKEVEERCAAELEKAVAGAGKPIVKLILEGRVEKGFHSVDMPTRALHSRFSDRAYIEIENRLEDPEMQGSIAEIQEGRLDGLTIRDLGMGIFNAKLRESGFDSRVNVVELFNALSHPKKEKAISETASLFGSLGPSPAE